MSTASTAGAAGGPAPPRISALVGGVAESATLAIDARAKAMKAAGEDVIGFGAGEPDFATPAHIVAAAAAACADPANHRYTPAAGLADLRRAVADKTRRDSGYEVTPAQVLVTNGGKHAVAQALATIVDPGDEVLVPAPYWTTYPEAVRLAGGRVALVPTTAAEGWRASVDALEAARTARTKALVFVSPANPTGAVYPRAEIAAIGAWAVEHRIWVVADEIYEHLVYGGAEHHSMPVVVPELAGTCVVVNGVAKTYAMTGWRVGWLIGPPDVVAAAANLQSHTTSNVNNVAQRAAVAALDGPLDAVAEMRATYERRRGITVSMLAGIDGVVCPEPEGAFYAFPDLAGVLGRRVGGRRPQTTAELASVVLDEARVAFVPGEAFGAPGCARFSYALADGDLVEGIGRVAKLLGG
ncbi:MAG: pyridoxal phosphate-dependent aminotransferase [Acidimicrobiales bacterium]